MAGPGFTQTFGGSALYPAQSTYTNLALTTDITLLWPIETSVAGSPVVADIIDVTAASNGLTISFSSAQQASTGYTALFNNIGADTFEVLDANGDTLMTVASGQAWLIYLADNSTVQGTWRIFQMGAGTSSANAAALAGAGLKAISTTLNEFVAIQALNANYVSVIGDRATALEWVGAGGTITLPAAGTVGTGWFVYIKNAGTGNLTVEPPTGTIDGSSTLAFEPESSAIVVCDGTNYFTIGFGQAINSIFDFISINLTGQVSPYILAGAQLNRISYEFTGVLTANMVVVVPNTIQQYWINNQTTGNFTLSFETSTPGTITPVVQGNSNILYCDGTNVIPAVTLPSLSDSGFPDGSIASPSIFFTSAPNDGIYHGTGVGISTSGLNRLFVDAAGHISMGVPDNPSLPAFSINLPSTGAGLGLVIRSTIASTPVEPMLQVTGAGETVVSIGGTPNINDLAIIYDGAGNSIFRQNAAGNIQFEIGADLVLQGTQFGEWSIPTPVAGGAGITLSLFARATTFALSLTGIVAGQNLLNLANTVTTGAQTATFAATNKPGSGTSAPAKWWPILADGVQYYLPLWT